MVAPADIAHSPNLRDPDISSRRGSLGERIRLPMPLRKVRYRPLTPPRKEVTDIAALPSLHTIPIAGAPAREVTLENPARNVTVQGVIRSMHPSPGRLLGPPRQRKDGDV